MSDSTIIRSATPQDTERLLAIYAYYVENTAVTFELEVPCPDEFRRRIEDTLERYPYLVLEGENGLLGYAYAGHFKARPCYDWSVETTIYLARDARGAGHGRRLYTALEEALRAMGIRNLYACITCPEAEDEYVTRRSVDFHARMGYRLAGTFRQCASKFGRWYDMVWMEKAVGPHEPDPAPVAWTGTAKGTGDGRQSPVPVPGRADGPVR